MAAGDLSQISGLGNLSIELLETVGVESMRALARADADQLFVETTKANQILSIRKAAPTTAELQQWIQQACEHTGHLPSDEVVKLDEEVADFPQVEEVLVAIPVSPKILMEKGIKASEVPAAQIVAKTSAASFSSQIRVKELKGSKEVKKPRKNQTAYSSKSSEPKDVQVGIGKVIPTQEEKLHRQDKVEPLQAKKHGLRTKTSDGLNAGKTERSRGYIRGVLYPQAGRLRFAAVIAVLFFLSLPVSLLGACLIVLNREVMWAISPAVTVVLGILYLMFATKMKCRICGQPLYISKGCHKHVKAHRIPVIGYILPTSLQLLIFSWFRCIYCGTSIRLKE